MKAFFAFLALLLLAAIAWPAIGGLLATVFYEEPTVDQYQQWLPETYGKLVHPEKTLKFLVRGMLGEIKSFFGLAAPTTQPQAAPTQPQATAQPKAEIQQYSAPSSDGQNYIEEEVDSVPSFFCWVCPDGIPCKKTGEDLLKGQDPLGCQDPGQKSPKNGDVTCQPCPGRQDGSRQTAAAKEEAGDQVSVVSPAGGICGVTPVNPESRTNWTPYSNVETLVGIQKLAGSLSFRSEGATYSVKFQVRGVADIYCRDDVTGNLIDSGVLEAVAVTFRGHAWYSGPLGLEYSAP